MSVLKNDEATLSYTQEERLRVIRTIATEGALQDPKVASVVLKALDGVDKQVLTLKRLKIEQQSADADKEIALLLAQASERRHRELGNPFRRTDVPTRTPDASDVSLGEHVFTEAELADSVTKTTAEVFLTKFRDENGLNRDD